jgi:hypothetical protein
MRRSKPSWGAQEARFIRPELWLLAITVVAFLLAEVWQSSRMAELSLTLGQQRGALQEAQARLEFVRAERDRRTTRAELAPVADRLGLAPLDASRVVQLPSRYLVGDEVERRPSTTAVAWAERAVRTFVPEAMARSRTYR